MDLLEKLSKLNANDFDYIMIKVYNKAGYLLAYYTGALMRIKKKIDKLKYLVVKELYIDKDINGNKVFRIEAINSLYK